MKNPQAKKILGPFVGHTSSDRSKIWLYCEDEQYESLFLVVYDHKGQAVTSPQKFDFSKNKEEGATSVCADCVTVKGLTADQKYQYKFFCDEELKIPFEFDGLDEEDLFFWTLPEDNSETEDEDYRCDFLFLSCHNPFSAEKKKEYRDQGWKIWENIPKILQQKKESNSEDHSKQNRVLFAILAGDQVYADEVEKRVLKEKDPVKRLEHYIHVYKKFWDHVSYRKVLCSLPSYLMWDDHDITDGWGSRDDSFKKDEPEKFKENWTWLFESAKGAFSKMQACRNPKPLTDNSFDCGFRVGRMGFVLADLRSHRNKNLNRLWLDEQFNAVKEWVESVRSKIDVLFFVTPVVFAHGAPEIDNGILKYWKGILNGVKILPGCLSQPFNQAVGDLRDDINDSWSAEVNQNQTEAILSYLFDLQNDSDPEQRVHVVILTGDIHTAGYSNLYSRRESDQVRPVIQQIVSSPVSNAPFPWFGEAFYRKFTRGPVPLGSEGHFEAQIAHHFTERNCVVCSLRRHGEGHLELKAKFYLENFPEPLISIFDLEQSSKREEIDWSSRNEDGSLKFKGG